MIEPNNPILAKMLERLFGSMVSGPSMNCRPHASRQRLDFCQFEKLKSAQSGELLLSVLSKDAKAVVPARTPAPAKAVSTSLAGEEDDDADDLSPEEKAIKKAWQEQSSLMTKLRVIADDARTYEQDTGVHVLEIGFPLLSLPPGSFGGRAGLATRRILAPIAFIPVTLTVKTGTKTAVEIACRGEGVDLVRPNIALLAWLEQQTGQPITDLFADEAGEKPWQEIVGLVKAVAERVEIDVPSQFTSEDLPATIDLIATPRSDDEDAGRSIISAAVVGLFPVGNQGLLRDTRELVADGQAEGPIEAFVRLNPSLETEAADSQTNPPPDAAAVNAKITQRQFNDERLITLADPCQSKAVREARSNQGLVIHGPPGTGKSQTIANIIGDHLAHNERVLFVCDKRTALDVVADRLQALGLGNLIATVHDAQRDQREFYRSVREQLDNLVDAPAATDAGHKLRRIDEELQVLHNDLSKYHTALMGNGGGPGSFHHLVGLWLGDSSAASPGFDERPLQQIPAGDFDRHAQRLKELLTRAEAVSYAENPWTKSVGMSLEAFLETPVVYHQSAMATCNQTTVDADAGIEPLMAPFGQEDLVSQVESRVALAKSLAGAPDMPASWISHWIAQSPAPIATKLQQLKKAASESQSIVAAVLDPELLSRADAETATTISVSALRNYANAFQLKAAAFAAAGVADATRHADIIRWMKTDATQQATARKRLATAATLAAAVQASSLDPSMLARFTSSPQPASTLFEWLSALNAYIEIAGKLTALFQSAKKKAAEPAVKFFGLSLNKASAEQVRQFLTDLQKRIDLQTAVEAAIVQPFADQPDDSELIGTFERHQAILKSLATPVTTPVAAGALPQDAVAAVNDLVKALLEPASAALAHFELLPTADQALRLASFGDALRARLALIRFLNQESPTITAWPLPNDAELIKQIANQQYFLGILASHERGTPLGDIMRQLFSTPNDRNGITNGLLNTPRRAKLIQALETAVADSHLLSADAAKQLSAIARAGQPCAPTVAALAGSLETLEGVLRVTDALKRLPTTLATPATMMIEKRVPARDGFSIIRRNVLAGEITRRLRERPDLQAIDGHRLEVSFKRYRELSEQKKELARESILNNWTARQKARLLATTGNRMNSLGADLRRRLTLRGERAMRLRQVIAHGRQTEGGDPLFDLRPVWMASPETVAQLFPRQAIFDVIVFDEASQCRLEEALPVLTRGKRVVIAGDPKQLPPTRFFESAVATSEDSDAETEQELFEAHQGEVEDLLTAALSLDNMTESYLNVHYRSRNSDLIGFSNDHFYGSRLQAIPGHPKNRIRYAPITLYRADGIYEKRRNVIEANKVCQIVHDLLCRADPPSIGIACFNMVQRDLIVETLEDMAEKDAEFARRLAVARQRQGKGSSEGLFVKNLENVQGDERDHLIISTTYGPTKDGKFRRSFGPLGMAGGGRRLNVLVTRAREELHLVTSIPRSLYASLPPVPQGATPGGAWLLFAYLAYAEQLKEEYEIAHRIVESSPETAGGTAYVRPSKTPSQFAKVLGNRLTQLTGHGSEAHWGNTGFCVDIAMQDPRRIDDVTLGIQCDLTRFAGTDDPVEWDVFQTAMHEAQGWKLARVWTPHFFRDPDKTIGELKAQLMAAKGDSQNLS